MMIEPRKNNMCIMYNWLIINIYIYMYIIVYTYYYVIYLCYSRPSHINVPKKLERPSCQAREIRTRHLWEPPRGTHQISGISQRSHGKYSMNHYALENYDSPLWYSKNHYFPITYPLSWHKSIHHYFPDSPWLIHLALSMFHQYSNRCE